ncbi:glycerate kinase (plasmid) [Pedobacter sp. BS3]|uniref:glycerate kinase n=1 Tax=Pedobacter sp. BS3 TaxID=2567937 RepID=UPI0011EFF234|nr:glycerate kinase [Pedobacter sp. BS3]TZF86253.1 glycerate kinase [Pedobacter sp. BS3]
MYKIIIAPNSFKEGLPADEVAYAIQQGLSESVLDHVSHVIPIGDGGDYTGRLLTDFFKGRHCSFRVTGAYGEMVNAWYGLIDDGQTAVLEIAETSGFGTIRGGVKITPLEASTKGLGELINHVLSLGISDMILCLGGSATVDGGVGMLAELGVSFWGRSGREIAPRPVNYFEVDRLDVTCLHRRMRHCKIRVLCDVNNTLLGELGAAPVFGPQKGATQEEVIFLEKFLEKFNEDTLKCMGESLADHECGGAAGGVAAACKVYLQAELLYGAQYFCEMVKLCEAISTANILITGEGCIDMQSLGGKAPVVVARIAKSKHVPVIGLAGKVTRTVVEELQEVFDGLFSIGNEPECREEALKNTRENLIRTSKQIGNLLAIKN